MPGASLWLVPHSDSAFNQALQALITESIPARFPNTETHHFIPHVTVTSSIEQSVYGQDPEAWIRNLNLTTVSGIDAHEPTIFIRLETLEAGDQFVKKLTLKAEKAPRLLGLAAVCRSQALSQSDSALAARWARDEYLPHLSLMYATLPTSEVQQLMPTLEQDCQKTARTIPADESGVIAKGGSLVLVDTSKPVSSWTVIATRELPLLSWAWPRFESNLNDD